MQKMNSRRIWLALLFAITALMLWAVQAQAEETRSQKLQRTIREQMEDRYAEDLSGVSPSQYDATLTDLVNAEEKAKSKFEGFGLSPALIVLTNLGGHDQVESAEIKGDKNLVRVTEDDNTEVGFGLETHYFVLPEASFLGINSIPSGRWGIGPYVAVTASDEEVIHTLGGGLMLGFRRGATVDATNPERPKVDASPNSFNIGIGVAVDPNVKVLGAGFKANQPAPAGETQVRFRDTTGINIGILFSYTFM